MEWLILLLFLGCAISGLRKNWIRLKQNPQQHPVHFTAIGAFHFARSNGVNISYSKICEEAKKNINFHAWKQGSEWRIDAVTFKNYVWRLKCKSKI
jgi:hypothetical protein